MKKIVVTGGAGYIGSVLTKELLDIGCKTVVLDKMSFGQKLPRDLLDHPRFDFVKGDIRHIEDLVEALKGADCVIHLACIVGDPACNLNRDDTISTNFESTKTLVEIAKYRKVRRIIFASTASVYGKTVNLADEKTETNPLSLYAKTKLDSEKIILQSYRYGITPVVLRLSTVFGVSDRMRFDLVLNFLTAKAIREKKVDIFGGMQYRPLIHVRDVAEAFAKTMKADAKIIEGEIFNVGAEENEIRIIDLANLIKSEYPKTRMIIHKASTDERNYRLSFKKIQKRLNFFPKYDLLYGIREVGSLLTSRKIKNYKEDRYYNVQYYQKNSRL